MLQVLHMVNFHCNHFALFFLIGILRMSTTFDITARSAVVGAQRRDILPETILHLKTFSPAGAAILQHLSLSREKSPALTPKALAAAAHSQAGIGALLAGGLRAGPACTWPGKEENTASALRVKLFYSAG